MNFQLIFLCISFAFNSNAMDFCDNWMPFLNEKCIKVINKLGTEEEAMHLCKQLDSTSTLITIDSEEEQQFINKEVIKYSEISDKMWLGVDIHKLVLNPWSAQSMYTNWADGSADLIGYQSCVQMSLSKATLGKWTDEPCRRKGLIACQRTQQWTLWTVRQILENITQRINAIKCEESIEKQNKIIETLVRSVETQENLIVEQIVSIDSMNKSIDKKLANVGNALDHNQQHSILPIGFIYIQLPNQSDPSLLWPKHEWIEITKQYSGLFFRAEGGNSLPFGSIQNSNYSRVTEIMSAALVDVNYTKVQGKQYVIKQGGWTENLVPAKCLSDFYIHYSTGEERPINTAIRVWKCTGVMKTNNVKGYGV